MDLVPYPRLLRPAALLMMVAGVLQALAGLQLLAFVQLVNAVAWIPVVEFLLGITMVPVALALGQARWIPHLLALVLTTVATLLSAGMAIYLLLNTILSPMSWFSPGLSLLALLAVAVTVTPTRRYIRDQERILAEAPFLSGPPPTPWWIQTLALGGALGIASIVGMAFWAPLTLARLGWRLEMLAHLRWPGSPAASSHEDYPYSFSPWEEYITYEARFAPNAEVAPILSFGDAIAEEVAWQLLLETGAADLKEAEISLWNAGKAKELPLWIASSLRARGVFYSPESLMSRSFDPWLHAGAGEVHLDCDQLTHLFAHVADRLALSMGEVFSPRHAYVRYAPPKGVTAEPIYVETTNFRRIDANGKRVDFMGETIGNEFFIEENYHRDGKGGIRASRRLTETAGFYEPALERDVSDSIVGNVLVGLEDSFLKAPVEEEIEAHLEGTRSYLLVSNLHHRWMKEARRVRGLGGGEQESLSLARKAVALRERFPDLIVEGEPLDRVILAEGLLAQGDFQGLEAQARALDAWYQENAYFGEPPKAFNDTSARALILITQGLQFKDVPSCDRTLGAVARYDRGRGERSGGFCHPLTANCVKVLKLDVCNR